MNGAPPFIEGGPVRRRPKAHVWVAAVEVKVPHAKAPDAVTAGVLAVAGNVAVIEVYCRNCRLTFTPDRHERDCVRGVHLRGGPRLPET